MLLEQRNSPTETQTEPEGWLIILLFSKLTAEDNWSYGYNCWVYVVMSKRMIRTKN